MKKKNFSQRCTGTVTLQRHMRTHEKLRFTCNVCTQKFETSQDLHRHRHTTHRASLKAFRGTDNLYHCSRCDEPFPDWHQAAAHFKKHAPAKRGSLVKNSELESKADLERHPQPQNEANEDHESSDIIIKNKANK
uniref:(northern house mosquito) hypothetical protein n=1 Tax=Culex pipiens TaxID=7175 RepID=A0A8D8KZL7_CULPI